MLIYQQAEQPINRRVADLLARMTLAEKLAQLHALWLYLSVDGKHTARDSHFCGVTDSDVIKQTLAVGLGQITRPLGTRAVQPLEGVRALNVLQKFLVEQTRLGIPVISHEECLSGLMARGATLFPSSLAYGATWNPELIEKVGHAIGAELLSVGCRQGLAPVLDVARDARWGRNEETFGEDPYMAGVMASRYVKGLQGEKRQVLATLKHFAGHSFSEGGRNHAPVNIGWRALNDDFLLPFEMAVKLAHAGAVMPAYHDIDNEPLHASRHLLSDVLRTQWGFDGLIVADYMGVSFLHTHHGIASDSAEAAALSFAAGLDVELPGDDCAPDLQTALERGLISVEQIDESVGRVLQEKFRLGLFEQPYADEAAINLRSPHAQALAAQVAEEAVTLLDNDGVLPLASATRIAIIGPTANDPLALLGDYSFPVHLIANDEQDNAENVVTILDGFRQTCGVERIRFAQGCFILEERKAGAPVFPGDVDETTNLVIDSALSKRLDLIDEAVTVAAEADVAVVCVGDLSGIFQTGTVGEGSDVDSLSLPGVQLQLLDAVIATGVPVVCVLTSGRPYNLGGSESSLAAQVMAFFGGESGGLAIAKVLTGECMPSGRLTLSVPRSAGACPYYYNHEVKSAGTPVARHFGSRYPFGHGLSYTQFEYSDLQLHDVCVDCESGTIQLSLVVTNTGDMAGVDVVQLYVRDQFASMVRPQKELKGFCRVELGASKAARIEFELPTDMLNFTGASGRRIVEPGVFDLMLGASSGDIRLKTMVKLSGSVHELPRQWRMLSNSRIQAV